MYLLNNELLIESKMSFHMSDDVMSDEIPSKVGRQKQRSQVHLLLSHNNLKTEK